jgi:hypothetical protein
MREMGFEGELLVSTGSPRKRINTGGYRPHPHVLQSLGVGLGLGFQLGGGENPSLATRGVRIAWWCIAVLCVPLCVRC